jgi:amino acid permease
MLNKNTSLQSNAVRYSRVFSLPWLVSLGVSVSVGIGIFILAGPINQFSGPSTLVLSYIFYAIVSIPIILTYAERSSLSQGGDGAYQIAKAREMPWSTFATGWVLIAGYIALTSLLAWGIVLLLNTALDIFLGKTFPEHWIAIGIIGLAAANNLIERQTLILY